MNLNNLNNLNNINNLKLLLNKHGFHFSKSKGQNFLTDINIINAIADASGADRNSGVLEIGPGAGILTAALARRAGKVLAIELDQNLLPILQESLDDFDNIDIIIADILKLDLNALVKKYFPDFNLNPGLNSGLNPIVCANLPYNITTPILEKVIQTPDFKTITVLLQKEVADRLSAPDGDPDGGAFACYTRYYTRAEKLFEISRDKFIPAPKVDSALLKLTRRERPAVNVSDEAFFFRVMRGGFLLRRKTLVNSLSAALPEFSKAEILQAFKNINLPANIRGERLKLQDFADLSEQLQNLKN